MNKEEYLNELQKYLKRLPAEDYQNAMDYFTEYFEDAGSDGEAAVIKELGTPKEAASELLTALLDERVQKSSLLTESGAFSNQNSPYDKKSARYQYQGAGNTQRKSSKSSPLSIVLIACLAILAAPIGAPLTICVLILLLCGLIFLGCCILCIFVFSVAAVFTGAVLFGIAFSLISSSLPGFCTMIGMGLLGIGFGILFFIAAIYICRWIGLGIIRFTQKFIRERKVKRHE